jgi:(1->4)-alpha-D-glucan 1-alpha-D-glucosylmutase
LRARRENRDIFDAGDYVPAFVTGSRAEHVVAFFRCQRPAEYLLAVAPRFLTSLIKPGQAPLGRSVWQDTTIALPDGAPPFWQDALTDEVVPARGRIGVADVLTKFPVALLRGVRQD